MALASNGIDSVGARARVDTTCFTDLFDAFGAEIDRGGLAVFRRAHLKPGMGVFSDAIREPADSIGWWGACIPRAPVFEDAGTVPNHPRHRTTTGQEVTIAERIACGHAVGSNQRVVSDPFDEAEQHRSVDHLDLHQLLPG